MAQGRGDVNLCLACGRLRMVLESLTRRSGVAKMAMAIADGKTVCIISASLEGLSSIVVPMRLCAPLMPPSRSSSMATAQVVAGDLVSDLVPDESRGQENGAVPAAITLAVSRPAI